MMTPTMNPRITTVIRMPGFLCSSQAMTSHPLSLQLSSAWVDVAPTIPQVSLHLAPLSAAIEPIGHRAKVWCGGSVGDAATRGARSRYGCEIRAYPPLPATRTPPPRDIRRAAYPRCASGPIGGVSSGNGAKPALA